MNWNQGFTESLFSRKSAGPNAVGTLERATESLTQKERTVAFLASLLASDQLRHWHTAIHWCNDDIRCLLSPNTALPRSCYLQCSAQSISANLVPSGDINRSLDTSFEANWVERSRRRGTSNTRRGTNSGDSVSRKSATSWRRRSLKRS